MVCWIFIFLKISQKIEHYFISQKMKKTLHSTKSGRPLAWAILPCILTQFLSESTFDVKKIMRKTLLHKLLWLLFFTYCFQIPNFRYGIVYYVNPSIVQWKLSEFFLYLYFTYLLILVFYIFHLRCNMLIIDIYTKKQSGFLSNISPSLSSSVFVTSWLKIVQAQSIIDKIHLFWEFARIRYEFLHTFFDCN